MTARLNPDPEPIECSICTRPDATMCQLACSHEFCRKCIRRWLAHNDTCPICRRDSTISDIRPIGVSLDSNTCHNWWSNTCYQCNFKFGGKYLPCWLILAVMVAIVIAGIIASVVIVGRVK